MGLIAKCNYYTMTLVLPLCVYIVVVISRHNTTSQGLLWGARIAFWGHQSIWRRWPWCRPVQPPCSDGVLPEGPGRGSHHPSKTFAAPLSTTDRQKKIYFHLKTIHSVPRMVLTLQFSNTNKTSIFDTLWVSRFIPYIQFSPLPELPLMIFSKISKI